MRKLGIIVEESAGDAPFSLGNVVKLPQLEMLKIIVEPGSYVFIPRDYILPPKLKKLTLMDTKFHWRDMSIVVSLPNLEELELIKDAFIGREWEPNDGDQFLKLKSLHIDRMNLEYWKADKDHFPLLQRLIIWECDKLKEFPGPEDIPTLEMVELDDASPSAVAKAKEMQQEQQDLGIDEFQVYIFYMWNGMYQKRKEEQEAYKRRREAEERKRKKREEEERERKRSEEEESYNGGYPDSFRRPPSSMDSLSRDWTPRSNHFGSFDDGLGHGFGHSRFDPGLGRGGFGSFR